MFEALYSDHDHAVWLDSATEGPGLGRFSFVGAPDGPLGEVVRYDVETRSLAVERQSGRELRSESVLGYCRDRLARLRTDAPELPFDFTCGFAGYLGFELKAECGEHRSGAGRARALAHGRPVHASALPDAALMLCDRLIAFDHAERHVYLLHSPPPPARKPACAWLGTCAERLGEIALRAAAAATAPSFGRRAPLRAP